MWEGSSSMLPGRPLQARLQVSCAISACTRASAKSTDASEDALLPFTPQSPTWPCRSCPWTCKRRSGPWQTEARCPFSTYEHHTFLSSVSHTSLSAYFILAPIVTEWKGHFSDFKINHLQRNPKLKGPNPGLYGQKGL